MAERCIHYEGPGRCTNSGVRNDAGSVNLPNGVNLTFTVEETGEVINYCRFDPGDYEGQSTCNGYQSSSE